MVHQDVYTSFKSLHFAVAHIQLAGFTNTFLFAIFIAYPCTFLMSTCITFRTLHSTFPWFQITQ